MRTLYGTRLGDMRVDAVALDYDHAAWLAHFDTTWPTGSPAAVSYRQRIAEGPNYVLASAMRAGIVEPGHQSTPVS